MMTIDDINSSRQQQFNSNNQFHQPLGTNQHQQIQQYYNNEQKHHPSTKHVRGSRGGVVNQPGGGGMMKAGGTRPGTPRKPQHQINKDESSSSLLSFASFNGYPNTPPPSGKKRSGGFSSAHSVTSSRSYSKSYSHQKQQQRRSRSHASLSDDGSEELDYTSSAARRQQRHRKKVGLQLPADVVSSATRMRSRSNSFGNNSKSAQKLLASSQSSPNLVRQQFNIDPNLSESNNRSTTQHRYFSDHESDISSIPTFPSEVRELTPSIYHRSTDAGILDTENQNRDVRIKTSSPSSVGRSSNKNGSSVRDSSPARSVPSTTTTIKRDHQQYELIESHSKLSRRVVDELNRAQFKPDLRIAAITNACSVFDHDDDSRHHIELHYGAAISLSKLLLLTSKDDETRMILSALEMVFRATPKQCNIAFNKISQNLLYNLLRLLDRLETKKYNMKHSDVSILNISKILCYLSRSSDLRVTLCRPQAMLQALARLSLRTMSPECRLLRVRIIANLANCGDENKVLLYNQEGLVDGLLRVGHFDDSESTRQYAATALMELSSASSNQISMAKKETLVMTLVKIILTEKNPVTRECAITSFQNLAYTKENRLNLVTLKDGIVLEALKRVLATDQDTKSRRRAAGALTNLSCEETAKIMGCHKGLAKTLAIVATKDDREDVQTRAALALTKIASHVTVQMECHETILDALVVASLSKAPNSVVGIFRVKARQPGNREILARHPGVVDTLCDICVSDGSLPSDRENAIHAIMHLINEDQNRKFLCTNKNILDALVTAANNYDGPLLQDARDTAIRALQRLATEMSNRYIMAHHPGLIIAVSKAVEREATLEECGQHLSSGYLAKPLLLSLLVAM